MVYQFSVYSYIELLFAAAMLFLGGVVASRGRNRSAAPLVGLLAASAVYALASTFRLAALVPPVALLWTQFRYLAEVVIAPAVILFALSCCIADVRRKPVVAAFLATASALVLVVEEAIALTEPSAAISGTSAAVSAGLASGRVSVLVYLVDIYLVSCLAAAVALSFIALFRGRTDRARADAEGARRATVLFVIAVVLAGYIAARAGYSPGSPDSAAAASFATTLLFSFISFVFFVLFLTSGANRDEDVRLVGYAALFQTMSEGALVLDALGRVEAFNIESVVAFPALNELSIGKPFTGLVPADSELTRLVASPQGGQVDLVVDTGERPRYFEATVTPLSGRSSRTIGRLVTTRNVTRQYELLDEVKALMIRDPLTGVYSRRHFEELAAHEMACAERSGRCIAIMRIDIDHFSGINEAAGRTEGDAILRKVAHACQKSIRSADILSRSGADGFLALLSDSGPADAERAAARLLAAASALAAQPSDERETPVDVSVSIGIAGTSGNGGPTLAELIRDAEQALQQAKEAGGNMVRLKGGR